MTVVSVSAQNTRLDDAEVITQWGSIGGGQVRGLETDFKYQNANCVARKGGASQRGIFLSDDVDSDLSGAGTYETVMFKFICTTPGLLDLLSVPGMRLEIGHNSLPSAASNDFYFYDVHGSDTYPIDKSWLILPVDPSIASHRTGTTGTPNLTLVDFFALVYDQTGTSKSPNQGMDAVDIGAGLTLIGGDGGDADGVWQDFSDHDWGTVTNRYGYVREVDGAPGVFLVFGKMIIGTSSAAGFTDGKILIFPDGLFAAGFSGITVDLQNASTIVNVTEGSFLGKGTKAGEDTRPIFTVTGTTGTLAIIDREFDNHAGIIFTSAVTMIGGKVTNSEKITQAGATIDGVTFSGATTADDVAFLLSDDPGKIDDCNFVFSDGHAIEVRPTGAGPFTFAMDANVFTGYGADTTTDAVLLINPVTTDADITINITNGVTPTFKLDAGYTGTFILNNNISITFSGMKDNTEVRIFKTSDDSVVDGIEDATAGSPDDRTFVWSAAAALDVYYVLHSVLYETIRVEGFIIPGTDTTIGVQQRLDRNYDNPA